jgi:hypothetical protein
MKAARSKCNHIQRCQRVYIRQGSSNIRVSEDRSENEDPVFLFESEIDTTSKAIFYEISMN